MTATEARQMSGPVPSPSMNGTMGLSGTLSLPAFRVILSPAMVVFLRARGNFLGGPFPALYRCVVNGIVAQADDPSAHRTPPERRGPAAPRPEVRHAQGAQVQGRHRLGPR